MSMVRLAGLIFILCLTTATGSKVLQVTRSQLNKVANSQNDLDDIKEAFKNDGVIAVTDVGSDYVSAVEDLRSRAPGCLDQAQAPKFQLPDGSVRNTAARSSESLEEFPTCIKEQSDIISDSFEKIYEDIGAILTTIAGQQNVLWRTKEVKSGMKNSLVDLEQKDHVHVYRPATNGSDNSMVPYHVDNGLLLMITSFKDHPLLIKNKLGHLVETGQVEEGAILVIIARGFTDWLLGGTDASSHFFAAPHSVASIGKDISTRTVFARMKVPPLEAVPFTTKKNDILKSFEEFFTDIKPSQSGDLCPIDSSQQIEPLAQAWIQWNALKQDECSGNRSYCWMSCLELPGNCPSSQLAHCTNWQGEKCCTEIDQQDGCLDMDDSCMWKCDNTNNTKLLNFCNGHGTDMYMQGFEVSGSVQKSCVILLFKGWILDTRLKFGFGCIGVIFLGILVEWLLCFRRMLQGRKAFIWLKNPWRKCAIISLFGLNIACGYLAMLVAMTYSMELFLCMVVGLVMGHAIFNSAAPVGESVDPCCASQRSEVTDTTSSSSKAQLNKDDCECN